MALDPHMYSNQCFDMFQFVDKAHVQEIITLGRWVCKITLVVFSSWIEGYLENQETPL